MILTKTRKLRTIFPQAQNRKKRLMSLNCPMFTVKIKYHVVQSGQSRINSESSSPWNLPDGLLLNSWICQTLTNTTGHWLIGRIRMFPFCMDASNVFQILSQSRKNIWKNPWEEKSQNLWAPDCPLKHGTQGQRFKIPGAISTRANSGPHEFGKP